MHWGTFILTDEDILEPVELINKERQANLYRDAELRRKMANDSLDRKKKEIKQLIKERTSHLRDLLFQSKKKNKEFLESNKHPVKKIELIR